MGGPALAARAFISPVLHAQMPVFYVGWLQAYAMLFYAVMTMCLVTAIPRSGPGACR